MQKTFAVAGIALSLFLVCSVAWGAEKQVKLGVKGLDCARSELALTSLLQGVDGVKNVATDVYGGSCTVVFDDEKTSLDAITAAINSGKFKVKSSEELR